MSYTIRPATLADNPGILDLVARTPQDGLLRLNFERDPDFHTGACVSCEEPDIFVATHSDAPEKIVAVINIGTRDVFLNGESRRLRYGNDLRIDPAHRGGMLLHRIFRRLKQQLLAGEWMQTVILDGNEASLSTVGSGRAGMPTYYPAGTIETHLLYTGARRYPRESDGILVRRANVGDLPLMQAFLDAEGARRQYFPNLKLQRMLVEDRYYAGLSPGNFLLAFARGRLVGLLGDWNQSSFKRTRVLEYPGALRWLRHGYNAVSAVSGGMALPAAGECFRYRNLHTICIAEDDVQVFRALVDRALHDHRDCDAVVCATFSGDPLSGALARYRRRTLRSLHFLVCYERDPRPDLDEGRLCYVDVARL